MNVSKPRTVIFLHIPKAAGTTLHRIIERQYRRRHIYTILPTTSRSSGRVAEFRALPEAQRHIFRMVKGHLWYGLHTYTAQPAAYFTLLREPVERVTSFYHYVRRAPDHYLHDYMTLRDTTLRNAIENRATIALDNVQTRMISGVWDSVPFGACDGSHLALAQRHLENDFAVVGVAERVDEVLLQLKHTFGWHYIHYMEHNVTKSRPKPTTLDNATLDAIQKHNQLDVQLYHFARDLCAAQISAQGPAFQEAVTHFQRRNKLITPLHRMYWRARKVSVRTIGRQLLAERL